MNRQVFKTKIRNSILYIPKFLLRNFYSKPKLITKVLLNPSLIWEDTYFPEMNRKSKARILGEQLLNIIKHSAIDEYYYMYGLDVKRNIRNNEYVLYFDFAKVRDKLNLSDPHNDSTILRNKLFFESVAHSIGIPTPINVAYSNNGKISLLHENMNTHVDWDSLPKYLNDCILFVKPIGGQCGSGILKIAINNNKYYHNEENISGEELRSLLLKGQYLFQKDIKQHAEMSRLYSSSVNTIRMTTIKNPQTGEIEILPPTLRVGAHGSYIDNFSKGGVIIAMETQSGKLADWGFFKPMYGFKSKTHPDTGIEFSSFKIPFYQEAKQMAIHFHSFLNLHSIGWDIAISPNGPIFIEGNDNWEINLPQTFENPMKKEFNRLFLFK